MGAIHKHMSGEETERYLMGGSPEVEAVDFEEHLLVCGRCRQRLARTDEYVASMNGAARDLRAGNGADVRGNWQLLKVLGAIGSVAGLMLLGAMAAWYY
jgi:hypothetical protein